MEKEQIEIAAERMKDDRSSPPAASWRKPSNGLKPPTELRRPLAKLNSNLIGADFDLGDE
jgi:hypothetical protein